MATLKQKKANPNSLYWRKKADNMWSAVIKQVGVCECCGSTTNQLNAHHIISRVRLKYRHDVSNGVCLCVTCHSFDPMISPHADSYGAENFLRWLAFNRPGQYIWYNEHKEDKRQKTRTYEECYEELLEIHKKGIKKT